MRFRKTLSKILIVAVIIVLGTGGIISFAENQKKFEINVVRYVNGSFTDGYALNDGLPKSIFQILSKVNNNYDGKTNYYCLNALSGSWTNQTIQNTEVTYNKSYKLQTDLENDELGINALKNDLTAVYSNIANSKYLNEILWILDNIYIPSTDANSSEVNEDNKQTLLNAAGMILEHVEDTEGEADIWKYKFTTQTSDKYNYFSALNALYDGNKEFGGDNEGWYYFDADDNVQNVVISDDLIEVAQQTALWYYTNYKDNNENNEDNRFNIKDKGLKNLWKLKDNNSYEDLEAEDFDITINGEKIKIGKWQQEQATILAWYLIDAANDYADSVKDKYWYLDKTNNIMTDEATTYWNNNKTRLEAKYGTANNSEDAIEHAKAELAVNHISDEEESAPIKVESQSVQYKKENGKNIIGPIKIEKQREAKYELNNSISINNTEYNLNTNSNIYLSSNNGNKINKSLNEVVGEDFYITINQTDIMQIGINSIKFSGNYLTNEKTLWVSSTSEEQPIVEVTPKTKPFDLVVKTEVPGKYNLELVKVDQGGKQLGSTARFEVTYPNSNIETKDVTGTLTIAKDVEINKDNCGTDDLYIIKETKAPDRYCKFDGIIKLTIKKNGANDANPYTIKNVSYQVVDESGAEITDSDDVEVNFDGNNIEVKVINHEKEFDLALQKYITSVISADGSHEQEIRKAPQIDVSKLNTINDNGEKITTAQYTQGKNPISVINGDYVLYTLSVYNEGELDGYVNKITDNIPKGLQFVYLNNNKVYAIDSTGNSQELQVEELVKKYIEANNSWWTIDEEGNTYKTDTYNNDRTISVTCDVESYLRTKKIEVLNYLDAYDSSKNVNGNEGLDRLSVTILLRVNSSDPKGTIIRNEAAITAAEDKYHTKQDIDSLKDRDSKVTEWPGKDGEKKYQDDEDFDRVVLQDEPKIHKGVKTIENQDSGYDADEEQTWVIESDIPRNIEEYKKYEIIDDIDYRLKFSGIGKVEVKIGDTTLVKDQDYTITYAENTNGVSNRTYSGTMKLVFIYNNHVSDKLVNASTNKINVTFKTTFAKDENGELLAKLGEDVENQAKLDYTNSNGEEKVKKSENPEVHTGGITLYKYEKIEGANSTNPIKDAEFTIYRTEADAKAKKNGVQTAISGEDGIVRFTGLSYGGDAKDSEDNKTKSGIYEYDSSTKSTKYWVVETKAPEGYLSNEEPIEVIINSTSYKEKAVDIDYKVPNTPITGKYSVFLVKEDEDGVQLNSKAEFKVNNQTREVVGRLTIVNNKEINKNNVNVIDVYTIEETKAPDRYSEFDGKITLQVSKKLADDGKSYIIKDKTFTIVDKNGKLIENNKDARVTLEGNSIFVHVKNYEKDFDLKLMKYISKVNAKATNRKLIVDASKLNTIVDNKKVTTANYNVSKEPIEVRTGDYVTYTLRVYNEGEIDGYAKEITENIPEGLKFVTEEDKNLTDEDKAAINFNKARAWNVASKNQDGTVKTVSTDYLSKAKSENNLITAYVGDGKEPKYKDVQIMLKVVSDKNIVIRNEAAITEDEDKAGKEVADRDSDTEKWKKENSEDLYDNNKNYPKYKEDDEDYDNIIVKNVDLALTKFIVAISDDLKIEDGEYLTSDKKIGSKENPYLRATKVDTSKLKAGTADTATYEMVKDPLLVPAESYVLYNIRVYNEGDVDVYAGEIKDHLPDYLDYVDCEFNKNYGWKIEEGNKTITTDYLSFAKGTNNIIKAFDKANDDKKGSGLSYKDVQILCRVSESAKSNEPIRNVAEVSKYEDKDGKEIDKDRDSTPNNGEKNEDDDDYEVVLIKTFDLSLIKFVSEVIVSEDGKTKTTATNNTGDNKKDIIPKVEVNKKKLNSTIVKFKYKIKITNEGDLEGYAKEITDYVPQGLRFYIEDNKGWTDEGNNVISTKLLENTLLKPGESAEVIVVLRWINGSTNLGLKRNNAEISEDYNEYDVPDKDSTPDNKVPEEDDYDYADVLLSISTGLSDSIAKYILGSTIVIIVLAGGIIAIKKFVL